ncbi:MAG: sulfatase-like hydrolase/transferase, partial [Gammaproteobacteria bacterium]|nr:sulfatase-like hydrolase/transferase [Gammaproteobacteria bacterium]
FRPGISSAVSTHVSIPMFFNIQYEPDNRTHIASGKTNLYRLAKSQGYQTAFISSQEMYAIASQVSKGSVDTWREMKHIEQRPETFDGKLIAELKSLPIDWNRPFFLTLNPRAGHIPYAKYTPAELVHFGKGLSKTDDYHRYMQGTYDDAMRYFDQVVGEIVVNLRQQTSNPTVVVITSDHGQRLGEASGYGHNTLEFGSARVPFIYLGLNTPPAVDAAVRELECPVTHFEAGRFIARLLGYQVHSPSEVADVFFINGVDLTGRGGSLRYTRAEALQGQKCSR